MEGPFCVLPLVRHPDPAAGDSPRIATSTTALGFSAEREAARHLKTLGYRVVARNVRTVRGEIDLIAWEGETLCFVEVKSRAHADFGGARAAVDHAKQSRLWKAAEAYLALNDLVAGELPECRFDVVAMHRLGPNRWEIELFRHAF